MSLPNPGNVVTEQRLSEFYQAIYPYLGGSGTPTERPTIYGFHIDNLESDPSEKVTYIEDAVGFTPAHMDFENDVFDYGSWENAFFMPKPCMLKYDGTVDYYLDPNDYSKKLDGTASDVADTSYPGNAMMEWGQNGKKIWYKIEKRGYDDKSANIYIADAQVDEDYVDWPFHNATSDSVDHFYTAIYHGTNVNNVIRSISGTVPVGNLSADTNKTRCEANNPSGKFLWTAELIVDIDLINILLVLIGKSLNTQSVFGKGLCTGNASNLVVGVHDNKGLFYGTNSGDSSNNSNAVKVFGMENWWGLKNRRYLGEIISSGIRYRKLTYGTEDGSSVTGYSYYTTTGFIPVEVGSYSGTSAQYLKECKFNEYGIFPMVVGGTGTSSTTYYSDAVWYSNSSGPYCPCRGGHTNRNAETQNGAFNFGYNCDSSYYDATIGSAISCKPETPSS